MSVLLQNCCIHLNNSIEFIVHIGTVAAVVVAIVAADIELAVVHIAAVLDGGVAVDDARILQVMALELSQQCRLALAPLRP